MPSRLSRRGFVAGAAAAAAAPRWMLCSHAEEGSDSEAIFVACDGPVVEAALLAQAANNVERFRKGDAVVQVQDADGKPVTEARVEATQSGHAFRFGCIIFDLVAAEEPYKPELFQERFSSLFNFAVFPFYWAAYEPRTGQTQRARIAEVVQRCQQHGIATKGHPLAWTHPAGVPEWLAGCSVDESERRLLERIRREVSEFAGLIDLWDVVNEPVNTRTWRHVEARDYLQEPIADIVDYVEKCLHAAHAANPQASLMINEYNMIAERTVRERFHQLAAQLLDCQAPLSALGIQAHEPRQHWYAPKETWQTFDRLADLGLPLHITEFIPQSGGKAITGGWRRGTWTTQAQADFAEQLFRLAFGHPALRSINWWGLSDRQIWLPGGGLVGADYRPKPVYERLRRLIHEEWHTREAGTTDQNGRFALRGFFGPYSIRITNKDGQARSITPVLEQNAPNTWTCVI